MRTTVWLVAALCGLSTSVALAEGPSKAGDKTDAARPRIVVQRELTSLDEEIAGLKKNREAVEHHAKILSDLLAELQLISFSKAFEPKLAEVSASFTRVKKKPSRDARVKFGGAADAVVEAFVEPLQTWTRRYLRVTGNPSLSVDDRTYARMLLGTVDIDLIGPAAQPAYKRLISQAEDADGIPSSHLQSLEQTDFDAFKALFTENRFAEMKKAYADVIGKAAAEAQQRSQSLSKQIKEVQDHVAQSVTELAQKEEGQLQIDSKLISYVLPAFALTVLVLFLVPLGFRHEALQMLIYSSGMILELVTVFLLTGTILILAVSGRLNPEVLGTLLGGISGYVLGRSLGSKSSTAPKSTP